MYPPLLGSHQNTRTNYHRDVLQMLDKVTWPLHCCSRAPRPAAPPRTTLDPAAPRTISDSESRAVIGGEGTAHRAGQPGGMVHHRPAGRYKGRTVHGLQEWERERVPSAIEPPLFSLSLWMSVSLLTIYLSKYLSIFLYIYLSISDSQCDGTWHQLR